MAKSSKQSFEEKLDKLNNIVNILDEGIEPLEDLLVKFEEGIKLISELRDFLNEAELKIVEINKEIKDEN